MVTAVSNPGRRQPGSISDYDPMNQQFGSIAIDPRQSGYQSHPEPVRQPQPSYQPPAPRKSLTAVLRHVLQAVVQGEVGWGGGGGDWVDVSPNRSFAVFARTT